MSDHTLQIGLVSRALRDWRIVATTMVEGLGGESTLSFTTSIEIDEVAPLGAGIGMNSAVVLRDGDGTVRFRGKLVTPEISASGSSETWAFTAKAGTKRLSEITFQQQWKHVASAADFLANIAAIKAAEPSEGVSAGDAWNAAWTLSYSGLVILNRTQAGVFISVKDQVEAVLDYANAPADGEASAGVAFNVTALPTVVPPVSQELDLSCMEAIGRQLAWFPAYSCAWRHEEEGSTLVFGDVTAGTTFGAVQTLDLRRGQNAVVVDFVGSPRWDLLVRQVRLTYRSGATAIDPDNAATFYNVVVRTVRASTVEENGSEVIVRNTLTLSGSIVASTGSPQLTTEGEVVPDLADLAEELHKPFRRPYFELRFSKMEGEVDWTIRPGMRWNVLGAGAAYEGCESVCQKVTRQIETGRTMVECGPPTPRGLSALLELKRANMRRRTADAASEMENGLSGEKKDKKGTAAAELDWQANVVSILGARYSVEIPVRNVVPLV